MEEKPPDTILRAFLFEKKGKDNRKTESSERHRFYFELSVFHNQMEEPAAEAEQR